MWWANSTRRWTSIDRFRDLDADARLGDFAPTVRSDFAEDVASASGQVFLRFQSDKVRRVAPDGTVSVLVLDDNALRFIPNTEPQQGTRFSRGSAFGGVLGLFADHDRLVLVTERELVLLDQVYGDTRLQIMNRIALPPARGPHFGIGGMRDGDHYLVCDRVEHVVWRIDMRSGAHEVLAGTRGEAGHRDGTATDTLFREPRNIAATRDAWWVTDQGNHVVRRIDRETRMVSTYGRPGEHGLADGDATHARFERPRGICAAGGRIWIADLAGALRTIDPETGIVAAHKPWQGITLLAHHRPTSLCEVTGGIAVCAPVEPALIVVPLEG